MNGAETYKQLQSAARSVGAKTGKRVPTEEYLIRHAIESFLDRLTKTPHAEDFVLKGGILLAAYGARRPTRDADAEAVDTALTVEHLTEVVRDMAALELDDGVVFDIDTLSIRADPRRISTNGATSHNAIVATSQRKPRSLGCSVGANCPGVIFPRRRRLDRGRARTPNQPDKW